MHRRGLAIGTLLAAIVLVTAACNSGSTTTSAAGGSTPTSTSTPTSKSTSSSSSSQSEAPTHVEGMSSIKMKAESFSFSPATLEGSGGQKLTIELENEASVPHNFSIDDQNISVTLQPGEEQDIPIVFPQSGSLEFYCAFHERSGMTGQLEVM